MTVYEKIKNKNIDELAAWLNRYGMFDNSPWVIWWDRTYCHNCKPVTQNYGDWEQECSWCEVNKKCRYFPDMDEPPNCEQLIKMWLESEG